MRDITTFLNEEEFASTPQSMPNMGAIQNAEISDTTAGSLTAKTGTDMPTSKKKKKDDEDTATSEKFKVNKTDLDQKYDITHPLYDVLDE